MALTLRSARVRFVAPLLVLALAAAACGGDDKDDKKPAVKRTTTTTAPPPAAPLTGVPQPDEAKRARPAMIVKVDNTQRGLSVQEGIEKADIVFVEQTEQGTTRLAAVYQSQDATVGPVRSARASDVEIAGLLNKPLLVYSGAAGPVLRQVRSGPLVDTGIDARGVTPVYQRNQRGGTANLYRYFLPTGDLYGARGGEGATPPAVFQYRSGKEEALGDVVKGAHVGYGGGAATNVDYAWNGTNGWNRTQNGAPHAMANTKQQLSPANVVILITPYKDSGVRDVTGAASPQAVLQGSGEAWFLSGGKLLKGSWSRPGPVGPITFAGAFGVAVKLAPGQTFIELAPGRGSATVVP